MTALNWSEINNLNFHVFYNFITVLCQKHWCIKIRMIHGMEKHAQYFLIYAQISHVFECICREHMISFMFPKSLKTLNV